MILMAYDGSAGAQAAMDRVAELMPSAEMTVLTVWDPFVETAVRMGPGSMGMVMPHASDVDIDGATQRAVLESTTDGAQRAIEAGMPSRPRTARGHGGTARAILSVAAEFDADLIVLGTRSSRAARRFHLTDLSAFHRAFGSDRFDTEQS